eukprot:TRINITY_DN12984_c0_g1_i9.p1 TRINITY_DN12984_c0_g1~~TRINITY_DN12984_c0_g1_i9.p1  ORF type:complete len:552 (+),score=234.00 TRINITY_DN12984_c0_g1_i9:643-2298(+)
MEANREMDEEYEKLKHDQDARKSQEAKNYRDQLRQQIEDKRRAAEREREHDKDYHLTGLDFKPNAHELPKEAIQDYSRTLQQQIVEKHRRPSASHDKEPLSQLDSLGAEADKERQHAAMERRRAMRETYEDYLRGKERKGRKDRDEKERELEDLEKEKSFMEREQEKQKKAEMDKKKELSEYLAYQIREKAKRKEQEKDDNEYPMEEHAAVPKRDYKKDILEDNLRMIQEKANAREREKQQEKQLNDRYQREQRELEEKEREEDAKRKANQRKLYEESMNVAQGRRDRENQEKLSKKQELDYYELLNQQLKDMIKREKTQQKEKLDDYKNSLDAQIAEQESAKKRRKEEELAMDRNNPGLNIDSYKRNPIYDSTKYREDLEKQLQEKKAPNRREEDDMDDYALMNRLADKYKQEKSREEQKRKADLNDEYKKFIESRRKAQEDERRANLHEQEQCEEDLRNKEREDEAARLRERRKRQELRDCLDNQINEANKKRMREKREWEDDPSRKALQDLEERMAKLRAEVERCIKCNAPIEQPPNTQSKNVTHFVV